MRSPTTSTRPPRSYPRRGPRSLGQCLSRPSSPLHTTCPKWRRGISIPGTNLASWMVIAPTPTPSTNFKGVSPTDALPVIPIATKNIPATMIGAMQDVYDEHPRQRSKSLPNSEGTTSFKCGDVNGTTSETPQQEIRTSFVTGNFDFIQPLQSSGRFLWRSYQCHQTLPSYHPRPKDPLHRCHLLVPVGEQNLSIYPKGHPTILFTNRVTLTYTSTLA